MPEFITQYTFSQYFSYTLDNLTGEYNAPTAFSHHWNEFIPLNPIDIATTGTLNFDIVQSSQFARISSFTLSVNLATSYVDGSLTGSSLLGNINANIEGMLIKDETVLIEASLLSKSDATNIGSLIGYLTAPHNNQYGLVGSYSTSTLGSQFVMVGEIE